jgi:predicted nucleotidyltransferase
MYAWGSLGTPHADAYSDIDVAVVIADDDYRDVERELPGICQAIFGDLVAWLPEGEGESRVNYAFLFRHGEDLLLYDLTLIAASEVERSPPSSPQEILLDRGAFLRALVDQRAEPPSPINAKGLVQVLNRYWVYLYLNGKYWKRSDIHKILYVQGVLYRTHIALLRFLHPDLAWSRWEARDVALLPQACREELLVYHGGPALDGVYEVLEREMDLFSAHTRAACQRWAITYPERLEAAVRGHLRRLISDPEKG